MGCLATPSSAFAWPGAKLQSGLCLGRGFHGHPCEARETWLSQIGMGCRLSGISIAPLLPVCRNTIRPVPRIRESCPPYHNLQTPVEAMPLACASRLGLSTRTLPSVTCSVWGLFWYDIVVCFICLYAFLGCMCCLRPDRLFCRLEAPPWPRQGHEAMPAEPWPLSQVDVDRPQPDVPVSDAESAPGRSLLAFGESSPLLP